MASQNRPASRKLAPDPATTYERAKPENESGMGQLDMEDVIPEDRPDRPEDAVDNRHNPKQINALESVDQRANGDPRRDDPASKESNPDA